MANLKETRDVTAFLIKLYESILAANADGDINWRDSFHFVDDITKLPSAIAGIDQVPQEFRNATEEEIRVLVDEIADEIQSNDPVGKEIIQGLVVNVALTIRSVQRLIEHKRSA